MQLFKEENFKIILEPEIKIIPEFKLLITRDKDRKKRLAFAELAYVYFMVSFKSPYSIYHKTERSQRIIREVKLPEGWRPDSAIEKAMVKYDALQMTPAMKSLVSIKESLLTSSKVIDALRERIEVSLSMVGSESDEDGEDEGMDIGEVVKSVTQLINLAEKIPTAIGAIESLEDKVKKEQTNDRKIKGGGSTSLFED